MKTFFALLILSVCITFIYADCDDDSWLKNLGCQIKKGAEDLSESAKTWPDKIGSTAKEVGQTVAEKYDQLKQKLTDDNNNTNSQTTQNNALNNTTKHDVENASSTEKIPLAPLTTGATRAIKLNETKSDEKKEEKPIDFEDRFLLQLDECPKGMVRDHTNNCRPAS